MKPKAPHHRRIKPSRKNPSHLDDIRRLPCLLSGRPAEAAHLRFADARHGKPITGMQTKPDDRYALPLCPGLHRLLKGCQHDSSEREWWISMGIEDPVAIALELYGRPRIEMEKIIERRRPWGDEHKFKIAKILRGAK